MKRLFSV